MYITFFNIPLKKIVIHAEIVSFLAVGGYKKLCAVPNYSRKSIAQLDNYVRKEWQKLESSPPLC
jgi:hypothetical protein